MVFSASVLRPVALVALFASSGCRFGSASMTSNINDLAFDPGGTVFAYLDAHDAQLNSEKDPRTVVVMTWIVFDPTQDLTDNEGAVLEDMRHELLLRDAVSLTFASQKAVKNAGTFKATTIGDVADVDDDLVARIAFAPERLTADSTYADIEPLGSKRNVTVDVTEAFSDAQPGVSGTLTIDVKVQDADVGNARTGRITGTFVAPLVDERIAEHNLAVLDVFPQLGVPLTERPTAEDDAEASTP